MKAIAEAILQLIILRLIGGQGRAFAKYRLAHAAAHFALGQLRKDSAPAKMDRKEFARRLKAANGNLRKMR